MGADPSVSESIGIALDSKLASRWSSYLTVGLDKDMKAGVFEKWAIPDNLKSLKPPRINDEIKLLASTDDLKKDSYLEHIQLCVGKGLSAFGAAFTILLQNPSQGETIKVLEPLADAAKLFSHCHFLLSTHRRHELEPRLNTDMRKVAREGKVEDELFGPDLSTRCKSVQVMRKASLDMKAFVKTPSKSNLNWKTQPRRGRVKPSENYYKKDQTSFMRYERRMRPPYKTVNDSEDRYGLKINNFRQSIKRNLDSSTRRRNHRI